MTRFRRYLLVIFLAGTVPAHAHERTSTRIRHAEPINLTAATLPSEAALRSLERPARVRFVAFGRPFELDIESNAAVLRDLPAAQRRKLPPHVLYKGRLADIPDSWLRLTSVDDRVYGAISDGTDVYAIAPARAISGLLQRARPRRTRRDVDLPRGGRRVRARTGILHRHGPGGATHRCRAVHRADQRTGDTGDCGCARWRPANWPLASSPTCNSGSDSSTRRASCSRD